MILAQGEGDFEEIDADDFLAAGAVASGRQSLLWGIPETSVGLVVHAGAGAG